MMHVEVMTDRPTQLGLYPKLLYEVFGGLTAPTLELVLSLKMCQQPRHSQGD